MIHIIQAAEEIGCSLSVEGENIRVNEINRLPTSLLNKIKEHKEELLDIMMTDRQANLMGFMVGISGTLYTKSINKQSNVYIEFLGNRWETWRETYQNNRLMSTKRISQGSTFDYVLIEAKKYFDYMERKRKNA
jgi:hypothetical protein